MVHTSAASGSCGTCKNNGINTQWYICTRSELKRGHCHTAVGVCIGTGPVDAPLTCLYATQQWLCSMLKTKVVKRKVSLSYGQDSIVSVNA